MPERIVVPDVAGTIRGYRAWTVDEWWLVSTAHACRWKPGWNKARCWDGVPETHYSYGTTANFYEVAELMAAARGGSHPAPAMACQCGLYACTNPALLGAAAHVPVACRSPFVTGVVECAGEIVIQERNSVIRAAKARIVALYLPPVRQSVWHPGELLADTYHAYAFADAEEMLAAYPPTGIPPEPEPERKPSWWKQLTSW